MEIQAYQREAWRFNQQPADRERGLLVALLGLGGEVGTLQTTLKKMVRDHGGHLDTHESAVEDLGDILWYIADAATWLGVDLSQVAVSNLEKIAKRWPPHGLPMPQAADVLALRDELVAAPSTPLGPPRRFDAAFGPGERFPDSFEIHLAPVGGPNSRVLPVWDGRPCGNELGDNSRVDDGYRFHDCFHLAQAAVLGWSPVMRSLMKLKRKSDLKTDDVEDGGRAIAIDEGISAYVFSVASRANWYESVRTVDGEVLKVIQRMVEGLEARACTPREWEAALLAGYDVWREVRETGHGAVRCDLTKRTIDVRPLTTSELANHAAVVEHLTQSRLRLLVTRVRRSLR